MTTSARSQPCSTSCARTPSTDTQSGTTRPSSASATTCCICSTDSASLPSRSSGASSRRKKHQNRQSLDDVVEVVIHPRGDEDDRARVHVEDFLYPIDLGSHLRPAARDVIHLVFVMRRLRIRRPCLKDVDPRAERRHSEEFEVWLVGFRKHLGKIKDIRVHGNP